MPTLEWIGKNKVVNHHLEVPYQVLQRVYSYDEKGQHPEDNGSENKIIHGDNLAALKSLLPQYEGKIKCIYIDPPYNTGNEGWVYNDNVNDPRIQKWLGKVVGKEGEDLSRHDKWLCMMYPRLRLLQKLLAEDGVMVISIGYQELFNLIAICNEIFSTKQIVPVTVQTSGGKPSKGFNYLHEYLVFIVSKEFNAIELDFCGGNERTPFEGLTLSTFNKVQRPNQVYPIFINTKTECIESVGMSLQELIDNDMYTGDINRYEYKCENIPDGCVAVWPITTKGKKCVWRHIPQRLLKDWKCGYIKVTKNKRKNAANQYSIQYLPSGIIEKIKTGELEVIGHEKDSPTLIFGKNKTRGGQIPTIWLEKEFYTVNGTLLLKNIFPEIDKVFDYPKSENLLKSIYLAVTEKNDIILDSFAGSGTTAHAVLNLNQQDGGHRKFILIEMMDYADTITAERVKRVIHGYGEGKNAVPGTGGSFSYYELGQPIFHGDFLNEEIGLEEIRKYVYFTETRQPAEPIRPEEPAYLGKWMDTVYYFHYDRNAATTLNWDFLAKVRTKGESYVMYADRCTLSEEELQKYHITFKKIPRDIARF